MKGSRWGLVTYLSGQLVLLHTSEVGQFVEMDMGELRPLQHFGRELAAAVHDRAEHLVVGMSPEQDLAGIQLVESASHGPYVNGEIIPHAENNFRSTVESTDKVWGDLVFRCIGRGS